MSEEALQRIAENKKTRNPALALSKCDLTSLPSELSECGWLKELDLTENSELDDLSPLAVLVNLQYLVCFGTQVADLSPLAALVNLQFLACWGTQVGDLSPSAALVNLHSLDCAGTQVADLSPLAALVNLQSLDCSDTQVADLSPISTLIQQDIPVIGKELIPKVNLFSVIDCPLICPPVEIARDSPQAVRDYFEELGEDGRRLNEVKVISLGEASSGKTSLVKQLMGEPFDPKESQTHGIRIRKVPFTMDDGDMVTSHLWALVAKR